MATAKYLEKHRKDPDNSKIFITYAVSAYHDVLSHFERASAHYFEEISSYAITNGEETFKDYSR
jgi:hypothetical protein